MAEDRHNPLNNPAATLPQRQTVSAPASAGPPDETFDDFIDEAFGLDPAQEEDDAGQESRDVMDSPQEEIASPPVAPPTTPPPASGPPVPPMPEPPAPRFAYNGDYYTLDELTQRGFLTEALQKANQFDSMRQQPPALQAPPQQPQAPQVSALEVQRAYAPMAQNLVSEGWIEEDVATLYPATVASMIHMQNQLRQVSQALVGLVQRDQQQQQQATVQASMSKLDNAITEASQLGGFYQGLADPEMREGFKGYMINELNPQVSQISAQFVAKQWLAYNHELLMEMQKQMQQGARAPAPPAAPPRGSARAVEDPTPKDPWDDMLEGIL